MGTPSMSDPRQRVRVPDPAQVRQGARRSVRAGIILLVLLTGFTAGGIGMLQAGELPGLPFAAGGMIAQLAVIAINTAALRVRATLRGDTVSLAAIHSARTIFVFTRTALLIAMGALAVYAVVRLLLGDGWTLLTTAIIGFALWLLHRGTKQLRGGTDAMIAAED